MFLADLQQLTDCSSFLLPRLQDAEASILREFEHSASTVPLRALKSIKLQKAIIAIGMFSLLESTLQSELGWADPFAKLRQHIDRSGDQELSRRFQMYRLAVNVLKHGQGQSHRSLLAEHSLPFRVRRSVEDEDSYVDLDSMLIDVDDAFLSECADVVQRAAALAADLDAEVGFA